MTCRRCRSADAKRWLVVVEGIPTIAIECEPCHNPQPPKPRWMERLRAKDMTGAVA